ncbi:MAG: zf-HC2 domain-containing protein [Armatimonadota bacterium]|nr:zf-HC2 domain-containing protein [Armatimonadota bacterium]
MIKRADRKRGFAEVKCRDIQHLIGAYLYGDLSAEEMNAVRLHVQECAECRHDLETRGAVIANLPNETPELTDNERMQLTWAVKGAIRNTELARENSRWGYAFAAGLVLAMGAAVAGIVVYNSSKPNVPGGSANRKPPAVVVKIQEDRPKSEKPKPGGTSAGRQAQAPTPNTIAVQGQSGTTAHEPLSAARQLMNFATTARRTQMHRKVAVEPPANVVSEPETGKTSQTEEAPILPEPTAPNDARTVSE